MVDSFFYPSMIKIVIHLKDKDNNIYRCMRECKMFWSQVKKSLELLYMYGFVTTQKVKGSRIYDLTNDGKKLRDAFCIAHSLINANKERLEILLQSRKHTKEDVTNAIKKDLLPYKSVFPITDTST